MRGSSFSRACAEHISLWATVYHATACRCVAVQERLPEVVVAYADALVTVRRTTHSGLVQLLANRAAAFKVFVLDLDPSITPDVFNHVNECVREFGS
jgi:hypothetical protein